MSTGDKLLRLRISKLAVILGLAVISSACMTHSLQTGLSEQDAQEIVVLMNQNGIDASAVKGVSEKKGEEKWKKDEER